MRNTFAFGVAFFSLATGVVLAQGVPQPSAAPPSGANSSRSPLPTITLPTHHGVTPRLDHLKQVYPRAAPENFHEPEEQEWENFPGPLLKESASPAQGQVASPLASPPELAAKVLHKFDGIRQGINYAPYQYKNRPAVATYPPDANGSVGGKYYFQWVNSVFTTINKNTGKMKVTPTNGNAIWENISQPASLCKNFNTGDPIVIYDKFAKRWLVSQMAVDFTNKQYAECVGISQTDDPGGTHDLWEYPFNGLNDYPKFGVWRDGYYATFNMFHWIGPKERDYQSDGAMVCAFEREKMLSGKPAQHVCRYPEAENGANDAPFGLLPADIDGKQLPSVGSPEYVVGFGPNTLRLWRMYTNWSNLGASRISDPTVIKDVNFGQLVCVVNNFNSRKCIPQKNATEGLDTQSDRMMYRLVYRNFGSRESLFTNHTIKMDNRTAIRWYELSRAQSVTPTPEFAVRQQQDFSPDNSYRWLGSIASDKQGNVLLAYNVSDAGSYPSLRFAGRLATDPLGVLSKEGILAEGKRSILGDRWGDYGSVSIDPVDDCTFWITGEYVSADREPESVPAVSEAIGTTAPNNLKTPAATAKNLQTPAATAKNLQTPAIIASDIVHSKDWDTIIASVKFPSCK